MTCRCCGQPLEPWEADFCEGCAPLFIESGSIFRILEKHPLTSRQNADRVCAVVRETKNSTGS